MLQNISKAIKVPSAVRSVDPNRDRDQTTAWAPPYKTEDKMLRSEFRHATIILASLANVNSTGRQVLDPNIDDLFKHKVPLGGVETTDLPANMVLMDALSTLLVRTTENVSLTPFPTDVPDEEEG